MRLDLQILERDQAGRSVWVGNALNVPALLAAMILLSLAGQVFAQEEALTESRHPTAGILLSLPDGFESAPVSEPYHVTRALRKSLGKTAMSLTVAAYPVSEKVTADMFGEAVLGELRQDLAVRGLEVDKKTAMTVAGIDGVAWRLGYVHRGTRYVAARIHFVREVKTGRSGAPTVRICYLVGLEAVENEKPSLLPTFGEIVKHVQLTDVTRPIVAGVSDFSVTIDDPAGGYSIAKPAGWYYQKTPNGVAMGQVDYLAGGGGLPTLRLTRGELTGRVTCKERAGEHIAMARRSANRRDSELTVVSEGPARLGEHEGYGFVLRQGPAKSTRPGAEPGAALIIAERTLCLNEGDVGTSYTLTLICQDVDPKHAQAVLDAVAKTFRRIDPTTQPTTAPATQPATTASAPGR